MVGLVRWVCEALHPRRAQGIESILVASRCLYRTIILGGASSSQREVVAEASKAARRQSAAALRLMARAESARAHLEKT
jgi:hypothetical protein